VSGRFGLKMHIVLTIALQNNSDVTRPKRNPPPNPKESEVLLGDILAKIHRSKVDTQRHIEQRKIH
jgi:hypothetical protein